MLVSMGEEVGDFDDDDYERAFREFDANKSSTFEFQEVRLFILQLLGLI